MQWTPHATVATIVEDRERFLLVHEEADGKPVYNQPAGHLEDRETLAAAAVRETLEETRWEIRLSAVVGVYLYRSPANGITYLRTCYAAVPVREHTDRTLDPGIIEAVWLTFGEIQGLDERGLLRSPMVMRSIGDYVAGRNHPLDVVQAVGEF